MFKTNYANKEVAFGRRRLPMWKSVLCAVLSITLALTLGTNLSYAAEFIPKPLQPVSISLDQTETKTLTAPEDGSSYTWQVLLPQTGEYANINSAKDKTFNINAGMVANEEVLSSENVATFRCNVLNEDGEWTASQTYNVTYNSSLKNINQANESELKDIVVSDNVVLRDKVSNSNDVVSNTAYALTVHFKDQTERELAKPVSHDFDSETPFSWELQLQSGFGTPSEWVVFPLGSVNVNYDQTRNVLIIDNGYTGLKTDTSITIQYQFQDAQYHVKWWLADFEQQFSEEPTGIEQRTGEVGSAIPTEEDKSEICPGGVVVNEVDTTVSSDGSSVAEIYYRRAFRLLTFNPMGGLEAPESIYDMYGKDISEPEKIPHREGYDFVGWYLDEAGTQPVEWGKFTMPEVNTILYAKWNLKPDQVRIIILYYGEKAEHPENLEPGSEEWYDSFEYVTEEYDYVDPSRVGQTYVLPGEKFLPSDEQSEYNYIKPDGSDIRVQDDVEITADGYAHVKVYMDRQIYTWVFQKNIEHFMWDEWVDCYTITSRWGKNIYSEYQNACNAAYEDEAGWGIWESNIDSQTGNVTIVNLLTTMDHTNHNVDGDRYDKRCKFRVQSRPSERQSCDNRYYLQKVGKEFVHGGVYEEDTSGNFTKEYVSKSQISSWEQRIWYSEEDFIDFNGFIKPDYKSGIDGPVSGEDTTAAGASFYYRRATYTLSLTGIKTSGEPWVSISEIQFEKNLGSEDVVVEDPLSPGTFIPLKSYIPTIPEGLDQNLEFGGWYFDEKCVGESINFDDVNMPSSDLNIYAKWAPKQHHVTFHEKVPWMEGDNLVEGDVLYGEYIGDHMTIPEVEDHDNYRFVSWYYMNGDAKVYFDPKNMIMPGYDLDLHKEYFNNDLINYKVYYKFNDPDQGEIDIARPLDGSGQPGKEVYLKAKTPEELDPDYKYLYTAQEPSEVEWAPQSDGDYYTFYYDLTSTLSYTVRYVVDDGQGGLTDIAEAKHVDGVSKNTVTEDCLTIEGYKIQNATTITFSLSQDPDKNIIYFYYDENVVTITYECLTGHEELGGIYPVGGSETDLQTHLEEPIKAASGQPIGAIAVGKEGYSFSGWYLLDEHGEKHPVESEGSKLIPTKEEGKNWSNVTYVCTFGENIYEFSFTEFTIDSQGAPAQPENQYFVYKQYKDGEELKWEEVSQLSTKNPGETLTLKVSSNGSYYYDWTGSEAGDITINPNFVVQGVTVDDPSIPVAKEDVIAVCSKDLSAGKYSFSFWEENSTKVTPEYAQEKHAVRDNTSFRVNYFQGTALIKATNDGNCTFDPATVGESGLTVDSGTSATFHSNGNVEFSGEAASNNFSLVPNEQYHFNRWVKVEKDSQGQDVEITIEPEVPQIITTDTNIKAYCSLNGYEIHFNIEPENSGYTDPSIDTTVEMIAGTKYFVGENNVLTFNDEATQFTYSITPFANPGYHFANWQVKDGAVIEGEGTIQGETTFVVNFVENDPFTINFGVLDCTGETPVVDVEGKCGTVVPTSVTCYPVSGVDGAAPTCTETTNKGYKFEAWYIKSGDSYVEYKKDEPTLTVDRNSEGIYEQAEYYAAFVETEDTVTITYECVSWDNEGNNITEQGFVGGTTNPSSQEIKPISGQPSSTAEVKHSSSEIFPTNTAWEWAGWSEEIGGAIICEDLTIMPQPGEGGMYVEKTYYANFKEKNAFYIHYYSYFDDGSYQPNITGGWVTPISDLNSVNVEVGFDETIQHPVTGTPTGALQHTKSGYKFTGWYWYDPDLHADYLVSEDDSYIPTPQADITLYADCTFYAKYEEASQVTLNYTALTMNSSGSIVEGCPGGSITGQLSETISPVAASAGGSSAAASSAAFKFKYWAVLEGGQYVQAPGETATQLNFVPVKTGEEETGYSYKDETYYAIFESFAVSVSMSLSSQSGYGFGSVTGDPTTFESGTAYYVNINNDTINVTFENSEWQFNGYKQNGAHVEGLRLSDDVSAPKIIEGAKLGEDGTTTSYSFVSFFQEDPDVTITYCVESGSASRGGVKKAGSTDSPAQQITETLHPITSESASGGEAVASKGNKFVKWVDDGGAEYTTATVKPDKVDGAFVAKTYYAYFDESDEVVITYKAANRGAFGYVALNDGSETWVAETNESLKPLSGTALGSTAKAKNGYVFDRWTKDEDGLEFVSSSANYVPQMPPGGFEEATYFAQFKEGPDVTLNYSVKTASMYNSEVLFDNPNLGGSVTPTGEQVHPVSGGTALGSEATVSGPSYVFWKWMVLSDDGKLIDAPGTIDQVHYYPPRVESEGVEVYLPQTYYAVFTTYEINISAQLKEGYNYGEFIGESSISNFESSSKYTTSMEDGVGVITFVSAMTQSEVSLKVQPYEDTRFTKWTKEGSEEKLPTTGTVYTENQDDRTFKLDAWVDASQAVTYKYVLSSDSKGLGSIGLGTDISVTKEFVTEDISAGSQDEAQGATVKPNPGYAVTDWSFNVDDFQQVYTENAYVQPQKDEHGLYHGGVFYVHLHEKEWVTFNYATEDDSKGTVDPTIEDQIPPVTGKPTGSEATPKNGYVFDYWTNGKGEKLEWAGQHIVPQKDLEAQIFIDDTYTAHFKEAPKVDIEYDAITISIGEIDDVLTVSGGSIDTNQESVDPISGDPSGSTATCNPGFIINSWRYKDAEGNWQLAPLPQGQQFYGEHYTPIKTGSEEAGFAYEAQKYYAVFTTIEVETTFSVSTVDEYKHGKINETELTKRLESNSTFKVDKSQGDGTLTIKSISGKEDIVYTCTPNTDCSFGGWAINDEAKVSTEGKILPKSDDDTTMNFWACFIASGQIRLTYIVKTEDYQRGCGGIAFSGETSYSESIFEDRISDPTTPPKAVVANQNLGFTFKGWWIDDPTCSGDPISTENPFTPPAEPEANDLYHTHTYYAHFEEAPDVTINYIAKTGEQSTYVGGTVTNDQDVIPPVSGNPEGSTAVAKQGFVFVNWTNSNGDEVSKEKFFKPEKTDGAYTNATYYANFQENATKAHITFGTKTVRIDGTEISSGLGGTVTPDHEDVLPITGEAQGSTATLNNGYKLLKWIYIDDEGNWQDAPLPQDQTKYELKYIPQKTGSEEIGYSYVDEDYYAVFTTYEVTVNVVMSQQDKYKHGSIEGSVSGKIESTSTYDVKVDNNGDGVIRFKPLGQEWDIKSVKIKHALDANFDSVASKVDSDENITWGGIVAEDSASASGSMTFYGRCDGSVMVLMKYEVETTTDDRGNVALGQDPVEGFVKKTSEDVLSGSEASALEGVTAKANPGYHFIGWYVGADKIADTVYYKPVKGEDGLLHSATYVAKFAENDNVTLTYVANKLYSDEGVSGTVVVNGTVSDTSETVAPASGKAKGATATPKLGYVFDYWSFDAAGEQVVPGSKGNPVLDPPRNDEGIYENATYYANFKEGEEVKIFFKTKTIRQNDTERLLDDTVGGSVAPYFDQIKPIKGTPKTSAATVNEGFHFVKWVTIDSEGTWHDAPGTHDQIEYTPTKTGSEESGFAYQSQTYYAVFTTYNVSVTLKVSDSELFKWGSIDGKKEIKDIALESYTPFDVAATDEEGILTFRPYDGFWLFLDKSYSGKPYDQASFNGWYQGSDDQASIPVFNGIVKEDVAGSGKAVFYARFGEKASQTLTYRTFEDQKYFGGVDLGKPASPQLHLSVYEHVAPHTGIAQGATATPQPGYEIDAWYRLVNGSIPVKIEGTEGESYYAPPHDDETPYTTSIYYVSFKEKQHVNIYYNAVTVKGSEVITGCPGGSVTPERDIVAPATGNPKATATVNPGYHLVGWKSSLDGEVITQSKIFHPLKDEAQGCYVTSTYYAVFEENPDVQLSYVVNDANAGNVTLNKDSEVWSKIVTEQVAPATGEAIGAKAKALPGYRFVEWTDYYEIVPVEISSIIKPLKEWFWDGVYEKTSFVSVFEEKEPVTYNYDVKTFLNDETTPAPEHIDGGYLTRTTETLKPATGVAQGSEARTKNGFRFLGWYYYDEEQHKEVFVTQEKLYVPEKDAELQEYTGGNFYAKFAEEPDVTITYSIHQTTAEEPGKLHLYEETFPPVTGNPSANQAVAYRGYHFVNWTDKSGKEVCEDSTFTPTHPLGGAYESKEYVAHFAPNTDTKYTIKYAKQTLEAAKEDTTDIDTSFEIDESLTQTFKGTTERLVIPEAHAINIPGYRYFVASNHFNIAGDGSSVGIVYYTRNKVPFAVQYMLQEIPLPGETEIHYTHWSTTSIGDCFADEEVDFSRKDITIDLTKQDFKYEKRTPADKHVYVKSDGSLVIQMYYRRTMSEDYIVEYYIEKLESAKANSSSNDYEPEPYLREFLRGYSYQTVYPVTPKVAGWTLGEVTSVYLDPKTEGDFSKRTAKAYYNRNKDTEYTIDYVLQNYDKYGRVMPGYHLAEKDPYFEGERYYIIQRGITGDTVTENDLSPEIREKEFTGFKYTPDEEHARCEIEGDGSGFLPLFHEKTNFDTTINYHVPAGFKTPESETKTFTYWEEYRWELPEISHLKFDENQEFYDKINFRQGKAYFEYYQDPEPMTFDIYYIETDSIVVKYQLNDPSMGSLNVQEEEYGYMQGEPKGSTATPSDPALQFDGWTDESGNVVSYDLAFNPGRAIPKIPVEDGAQVNETKITQVFTANFSIPTYDPVLTGDFNYWYFFGLLATSGLCVVALFLLLRRKNEEK